MNGPQWHIITQVHTLTLGKVVIIIIIIIIINFYWTKVALQCGVAFQGRLN